MRTFILSIASLLVFTGLAQAQIQEPPLLPDLFGVAKTQDFFQTDTNSVFPETFDEFGGSPFEFEAFYDESLGETVTSVNLHTGAGDPISPLTRFIDLNETVGDWELTLIPHHFATKAELDAAFPNTTYQLQITSSLTNDSLVIVPLNFGSTDNYFDVPQLSNTGFVDGVLKFNFNQDFTFNWNTDIGFVNGTDRLFLFTEEHVTNGNFFDVFDFETDVYQSSFFLPGGTLDPLKTYESELIFARVVDLDVDSIDGHAGAAAFATITSIELMHVPEPGTYGLIFGLAALGFVILRRRRS